MKNLIPILYVIIPCYNEEETLGLMVPLLRDKIRFLIETKRISSDSRVLFVDDGSKDNTWNSICSFHEADLTFIGLKLSRNRGQQNALLAGLMEARGLADITISMDCDGQDDINAMDEMIDAYYDGCEIVYGIRKSRSKDSLLKRSTAHGYYKLLGRLGGEVIFDHADYRLVSARALDALAEYKEVNLFLRGMFPLIGFKSTCVEYERQERMSGKSKYSPSKMISLALDGITSFSIKPIHFISLIGAFAVLLSIVLIVYAIGSWILGYTVPGWSSTFISCMLIGGIQLICLGVIGEYVGKIYMETKGRPRYIIEEKKGLQRELLEDRANHKS